MSGFKVQAYEPAGDRIMTKWGEDIDPSSVWEEVSTTYNGAVRMAEPERSFGNMPLQERMPQLRKTGRERYFVPFCAESSLSQE